MGASAVGAALRLSAAARAKRAAYQRLLALRWQLSQLRQQTGYAVPLALQGLVGSAMSPILLWQAALPGEAVKVWQPSCAPCSIPAWVSAGGAVALEQQVLMNSLMGWFEQHIHAVLTEENTDLPPLTPAAVLWGLGPSQPGSLRRRPGRRGYPDIAAFRG